jgi:hypothetical protein
MEPMHLLISPGFVRVVYGEPFTGREEKDGNSTLLSYDLKTAFFRRFFCLIFPLMIIAYTMLASTANSYRIASFRVDLDQRCFTALKPQPIESTLSVANTGYALFCVIAAIIGTNFCGVAKVKLFNLN